MKANYLITIFLLMLGVAACGGAVPGTPPDAGPSATPPSSTAAVAPSPGSGMPTAPGDAGDDLDKSAWVLTSLGGGSPIPGSTANVQFEAGQMTGFAGCNTFWATYRAEFGGALEIGPVASTKMACAQPPGVQEQETAFIRWLEQVDGYSLDGETLALHSGGRREVLVLTRKPE